MDRTGGSGFHGRGAASNPPNRFEKIEFVPDLDFVDDDPVLPTTQFFRDASRSVLTTNDSPDVPFDVSINPYRGCEHGCIYCYARPTHEYFGLSAGLDFETKIFVKEDAPDLLRRELSSPKWTPRSVALSGVTDPYQPIERRLRLTRRCLEVFAEFRNPVEIVTKNRLVTRDGDVLAALARDRAAAVHVSVTTLDDDLVGVLEPRTSRPKQRLAAIEELSRASVPVSVLVAPVIPGLTDHEIPAILEACARAGAQSASYVMLRLPHAVRPLFEEWLTQHSPLRATKVLNRLRSLRGGKLNDPRFGSRMKGEGVFADEIASLFEIACRKAGLADRGPELSTAAFRRPTGGQLSLFDSR
ncbi:MAG: PA0069 family radical SAM protein [Planctomycetes bacterium]|nr:PA0069 family radical SAM protein [Planctomycetota bacterium]MBI3847077.1 PA0069 family radical SAM protein [Planctomycetota bacterium]